jgi:hypothetical protein
MHVSGWNDANHPRHRLAERVAKSRGVMIAATLESVVAVEPDGVAPTAEVKLPLIPSRNPGSLDPSQYNFDDSLA